jgi:NitT/TauT family transport system ATP-binding protein
MDEPFSSLDAPTRESLQALTLELCNEAGLTVVLVTHSIEEAAFIGQKVLLLHNPPNHQAQVVDNPHHATAAYRCSGTYQAACSLLRGRIEDISPSVAEGRMDL